jgi:ankyrin repeat protein
MKMFMRSMLCLAVLAGGLVMSSDAGYGRRHHTPKNLIYAVQEKQRYVIDYAKLESMVLSGSYNINEQDSDGWTALDYAEQAGDAEAANLLRSNGAMKKQELPGY